MLDVDTVASARSFDAALHSAGGAVRAVEALLSRRGRGRLLRAAAARPPRRAGARDGLLPVQQRRHRGAPRARRARRASGCSCSTGTSTTATGPTTSSTTPTRSSTSASTSRRCIPGTGSLTENGTGAGEGYTVNLPVPPGARPRRVAVAAAARGRRRSRARTEPDLLLVSAGFDAHRDDPLANCELTEESYAAMSRRHARARRASCRAPLGFVLEGGYDLRALARVGGGDDGGGARRRGAAGRRSWAAGAARPRALRAVVAGARVLTPSSCRAMQTGSRRKKKGAVQARRPCPPLARLPSV